MQQNNFRVQSHVKPVKQKATDGPPACFVGSIGFRIGTPTNKVYNLGSGLIFTIITDDHKFFDWRANTGGIRNIFVSGGGQKQNVYYYDGKEISDTNLVSPQDHHCKLPYLCHIDICFEPGHGCPSVLQLDCANICYDQNSQHPPHILDEDNNCVKNCL